MYELFRNICLEYFKHNKTKSGNHTVVIDFFI